MDRFRKLVERRPLPFAILAMVAALVVDRCSQAVSASIGLHTWIAWILCAKLLTAAVAFALLWMLGQAAKVGFRTVRAGTGWLLWLPFAMAFVWIAAIARSGPRIGSMAFAAGLAVGLSEELWFRGLILRALRSFSPTRAAVASALLFGAYHLSWLDVRVPVSVAYMVFYTAIEGLLWAALRQRTGSIVPCILLHAVMDGNVFAHRMHSHGGGGGAPFPSVVSVTFDLTTLAYAVWLLRTAPKPAADAPAPAVAA